MDAEARPLLLLTGVMAAGKSSVAQAVAERVPSSVHLRGDLFRRMIVNGRADMAGDPSSEALRQLRLRYRAAAATAMLFRESGFNVVYQDVILGPMLGEVAALYAGIPLRIVVLCPRAEIVAARERARSKTGYGAVTIAQLQDGLANTPRLGSWIDSSEQTVAETAEMVLRAWRGQADDAV